MLLILYLVLVNCESQCPTRILDSTVNINVNPLYYDELVFQPLENQDTTLSLQGADQNQTIFQLLPLSITTFYFDFRHLSNYSNGSFSFFDYINQWGISIVQNGSLDILNFDQDIQTQTLYAQLSSSFLDNQTSKIQAYQFSLLAFTPLEISLQMSILEQDFYSYNFEFINTTKIANQVPYRSLFNQNKIFAILIQATDLASLPMNPLILNNYLQPSYILSYSPGDSQQPLIAQAKLPGINTFSPNSLYWGSVPKLLLPYIPYFSNCQGYGQYIFLSQLIESSACQLVSYNDTKPINPYVFGDKSIGDQCINIPIQCILDETLSASPAGKPPWYSLQPMQTLFTMIQDPLWSEEITNLHYDEASIVLIQPTNSIPQNQMAGNIQFVISYYQVTKSQKRIISGSITFGNFYDIQQGQMNGTQPVYYELIFNYLPLTQPALVNAFALGVPVYFILYLGIGTLSVLQIVVFFFYHYILNRKQPRPRIKFWSYAKAIYPASIKGVFVAVVPIATIYLLIALIMNGQLYTFKIPYAASLAPATDSDSSSAMVIFDMFKNNTKYSDPNFVFLRAARCGMACIICGIYLMVVLTKIFVTDYDQQLKEVESYNGNIWYCKLWRRSQMFYTTIMVTIFMVMIIQFSFTNLFSNNSWYFLIGYKIFQLIIEYILEEYFEDSMNVTPLGSIMALTISIAMMGNATFYAFLFSYFIDVGTQMVERVYVMKVVEDITSFLEQLYIKVLKMIKKLTDEDSDEEDTINELIPQSDEIIQQNNENSDSDIIFSDLQEENFASDDDSFSSLKVLIKVDNTLSHDQDNSFQARDIDDYEDRFKQVYIEQQKKKLILESDGQKDLDKDFSQIFHNEEDDEVELQKLIPYFENFAVDIVTLYQQPLVVAFMWLLYDQSYWASNYQITKTTFIFYLIWNFLLIPFQIVIDILFYNLIEQYHGFDFLSYIYKSQSRFDNRKTAWVGQTHDYSKVGRALVILDQYCFSSQFYFLVTLYVSAIFLVIMGTQIIYFNNYNIFADQALIFICIFWYIICIIVHKFYLFIAKKFGLWSIDKKISSVHPMSQQIIETKPNLQTNVDESNIQEKKNLLIIRKWDDVVQLRDTETKLKEISNNLSQDQLKTDQFRKLFTNSNKVWVKDNMKSVFSPRTLKSQRKLILTSFINLYGVLKVTDTDEQAKKFDLYISEKQDKPAEKLIKNSDIICSPQTQAILKYWLFRKRHLKRTTSYIGGLMEKATQKYCQFCGLNWGLTATSDERIEDIHLKYIKSKDLKLIKNWLEIDEWQNFFEKKVILHTVCLLCDGFSAEELHNNQQIKRHQVRKYSFQRVARGIFYWLIFYRHRVK